MQTRRVQKGWADGREGRLEATVSNGHGLRLEAIAAIHGRGLPRLAGGEMVMKRNWAGPSGGARLPRREITRAGILRIRNFIPVIAAALLTAGCSVQYVDDTGVRHYWGLNHVQVKAVGAGRTDVSAQQVTTFGVALIRVPEQMGFSLGYARNFTLQVFTDTAGELTFDRGNPINFAYKDFDAIWEEHK